MPETEHPEGCLPYSNGEGTKSTTCWSVIVRAQGEGRDAQAALGDLIRRYENTVVTLVRAYRLPWNSTAEDLKQAFFLGVIERDDVRKLDRSRGRFRDWLRVAVKHSVINHRQHWNAVKRRNSITSARDFQVVHGCTPELLFMRQFAEDTLVQALARHRAESRDPARFDRLRRFLEVARPRPDQALEPDRSQLDISEIAALAAAWGIPRNRLSVQIYELRERHERVLRSIVADTLDVDPTDPGGRQAIDLEMGELYRLLCDVPPHHVVLEDA